MKQLKAKHRAAETIDYIYEVMYLRKCWKTILQTLNTSISEETSLLFNEARRLEGCEKKKKSEEAGTLYSSVCQPACYKVSVEACTWNVSIVPINHRCRVVLAWTKTSTISYKPLITMQHPLSTATKAGYCTCSLCLGGHNSSIADEDDPDEGHEQERAGLSHIKVVLDSQPGVHTVHPRGYFCSCQGGL